MIKSLSVPSTLIASAICLLATVSGPAQAAGDAQGTLTVNGKGYDLRLRLPASP